MYSSILALLSCAAATSYSLVTIHSGSEYQYAAVKLSSDGHLSLNGETDLTVEIGDDGLLYANGEHTDIFNGFPIVKTDGTWGGNQWSISDGVNLAADGSTSFFVCPEINDNIAYGKYGAPTTCANPVGIALYAHEL